MHRRVDCGLFVSEPFSQLLAEAGVNCVVAP